MICLHSIVQLSVSLSQNLTICPRNIALSQAHQPYYQPYQPYQPSVTDVYTIHCAGVFITATSSTQR